MNPRTWFVAAGSVILLAVAISGCTAWASQEIPEVLDSGGRSKSQAMQLGIREQYSLVGEHYRQLNDLVADTQLELYDGDWVASEMGTNYTTLRGSALSGALEGQATLDNSYYLARIWRLENLDDAESKLDEVKDYWNSLGWATTKAESGVTPGEFSVTGRVPAGPWMSIDMLQGGIVLRAHSGVYWGDRDALAVAIWNIQQTERSEGSEWRPSKVNAEGHGLIRPGEYPPFPQWRPEALWERIEESQLEAE